MPGAIPVSTSSAKNGNRPASQSCLSLPRSNFEGIWVKSDTSLTFEPVEEPEDTLGPVKEFIYSSDVENDATYPSPELDPLVFDQEPHKDANHGDIRLNNSIGNSSRATDMPKVVDIAQPRCVPEVTYSQIMASAGDFVTALDKERNYSYVSGWIPSTDSGSLVGSVSSVIVDPRLNLTNYTISQKQGNMLEGDERLCLDPSLLGLSIEDNIFCSRIGDKGTKDSSTIFQSSPAQSSAQDHLTVYEFPPSLNPQDIQMLFQLPLEVLGDIPFTKAVSVIASYLEIVRKNQPNNDDLPSEPSFNELPDFGTKKNITNFDSEQGTTLYKGYQTDMNRKSLQPTGGCRNSVANNSPTTKESGLIKRKREPHVKMKHPSYVTNGSVGTFGLLNFRQPGAWSRLKTASETDIEKEKPRKSAVKPAPKKPRNKKT